MGQKIVVLFHPFSLFQKGIKQKQKQPNTVAGPTARVCPQQNTDGMGLHERDRMSDLTAEKPLSLIQRTTNIESSSFQIYAGRSVKHYKGNLYPQFLLRFLELSNKKAYKISKDISSSLTILFISLQFGRIFNVGDSCRELHTTEM